MDGIIDVKRAVVNGSACLRQATSHDIERAKRAGGPSFHLITLSALASTVGGIARPICFAVLRLITNSNFLGCSTRQVAGLGAFENLIDVRSVAGNGRRA